VIGVGGDFNAVVKIGDHIIPQVTRFKYLGSIVQNDGEVKGHVNHRIQDGWLKGVGPRVFYVTRKYHSS